MDLIADTTLLVGLWRRQPWALEFAQGNQSRVLGLPWIVLGEFRHGARRAGHDPKIVDAFLQTGLPILEAGPSIPFYARVCAEAQDGGFYQEIGQNDLWIASVCLASGLPLVSRNRRHFEKIGGIKLLAVGGL